MSQALYRRYRPETFADVIGQEHVTGPLQQALRADRVNHAYLFSGPRGCGKTTSARILARCLNCAKGPTPTPCGECDSCVGLARGGPGTLDVIEIDAASHGGVDDARDLRDKAYFSPASSRYKVYIIDEAHMVTTNGFNALLKIVEEPPPHLKFIFATTEPDKVISTIRSRTHHYPFRLVPPGRLQAYLAELCEREGAVADKAVLPLVVRAGRGSVRDSLSVLDQLIAGADAGGVTYALAVGLLGFTDAALLDGAVEAFAAADGAAVFRTVDQVVEAGLDPRRFAEDLLERLRDLIVIDAVPDAAGTILGDAPADQLERMRSQAALYGAAELSRAADIFSVGLTEMRGATAPRLQLELMCARVLLPGAQDDTRSLQARLERIERRLAVGGGPPMSPDPVATQRHVPSARATQRDVASQRDDPPAAGPPAAASPPPPDPVATQRHVASDTRAQRDVASQRDEPPPTAAAPAGMDLAGVRSMWTEVMSGLFALRRATWTLVSQNAKVAELGSGRLVLAFSSAGLRDAFLKGAHPEWVHQALVDVLGLDVVVEAIIDPSAGGGPAAPASPAPPQSAPRPTRKPAKASAGVPPAPEPSSPEPRGPRDTPRTPVHPDDDVARADDADAAAGPSGQDLLMQELGATVIGEYDER